MTTESENSPIKPIDETLADASLQLLEEAPETASDVESPYAEVVAAAIAETTETENLDRDIPPIPEDGEEKPTTGEEFKPLAEEDYLNKDTQHVVIEKAIDGPIPKNINIAKAQYISVLNHTVDEFNRLAENMPKANLAEGEAGQQWALTLKDGMENLIQGNSLLGSLAKATAEWAQVVEQDTERLTAGRPALGKLGEGEKLTGDRAMFQVMGALGLGSIIQIPLWHSGIWVSIKAPSDAELHILDERLADEKVELGNLTSGLLFSNSAVFLNTHLLDFAMEHIYDSTLKDTNTENLRKVIRQTDIPLLLWGLACAIYPNGYPYRRPCITDVESCQHVTEAMLYLPRLCWTDRNALNKSQKKHMINRKAKHAIDTVMLYQSHHTYGEKEKVEINEHLSVVLKVPSIEEYIDAGFSWINGIVEMIDDNFGSTLRGEDRQRRIITQGNHTTMRQYSHWVDKIVIKTGKSDDEQIIDSPETVNNILAKLSGEEEIRTIFLERVGQYIDKSTISLIGVPRYKCPACGKPQGNSDGQVHPYIIPLDVSNIFFILMRRRIAPIQN